MKKDKTIYIKDLKDGFNQLITSTLDLGTPVYMNFGNHDMNVNEGYKIVSNNNVEECTILKEELKFNSKNMHVSMNHTIKYGTHTIIIMIDTTIYCPPHEFIEKFITCYSEYLNEATDGLQVRLQQMQSEYVSNAVRSFKGENIILVGHNPLIYEKTKGGKNKKQMDGGVEFTDLFFNLQEIDSEYRSGSKSKSNSNSKSNSIFPKMKYRNIYYLCADYHQYEEGSITITKGNKSVVVHQYIAGIGGTELDPFKRKQSRFIESQDDYTLDYVHVKTKTQHGLLQASYDNGWEFNFIPIRSGIKKKAWAQNSRNSQRQRNLKGMSMSKHRRFTFFNRTRKSIR